MNTSEEIRREIVDAFDKCRPAFDALADQTICTIRDAWPFSDKSIPITECAVSFSDITDWNEKFQSFRPPPHVEVEVEELHRIFLAYLMSICLHRLVWP